MFVCLARYMHAVGGNGMHTIAQHRDSDRSEIYEAEHGRECVSFARCRCCFCQSYCIALAQWLRCAKQ